MGDVDFCRFGLVEDEECDVFRFGFGSGVGDFGFDFLRAGDVGLLVDA